MDFDPREGVPRRDGMAIERAARVFRRDFRVLSSPASNPMPRLRTLVARRVLIRVAICFFSCFVV